MVFANQEAYYDAIQKSNDMAQSGPFIEFMLQKILNALTAHQGEHVKDVHDKLHDKMHDKMQEILNVIREDPRVSAPTVALILGVSERLIRSYFAKLKEEGYIERIGSNKSGYWRIIKDCQ